MDKYEKKFLSKNKKFIPTKGSGNVGDDGDFRFGSDWLVEYKYRNKKTIWISLSWMSKIIKQAIFKNRKPLLIFENDECSVAYFQFGDIDMMKNRFNFDVITSSRSIYLRNDVFIDSIYRAKKQEKIYMIEYEPKNLMIMEYNDFQNIIKKDKKL